MHRLSQKVADAFHNQSHSHSTPLHSNSDLTSTWERDQYRYRKHRGVNLGSWFVLERWIAPSPFRCAQAPAQSDLDVARGAQAKEILESHWDTWMTDEDWGWIAERGINAVRIPIGYYHLCGLDPSVIHGTDFEGLGHVYGGAWRRICDAIETARRYGIGVLVDLHAAPGKQNPDSHSGTSNPPTFFTDPRNKSHTIDILRILVRALSQSQSQSQSQSLSQSPSPSTSAYSNIIGIELLNEPHPPNANDDVLKQWYTTTIHALRRVNPSIPIYIGDCWRMEGYAEYIKSLSSSFEAISSSSEAMKMKEEEEEEGMIILDHHLYRCFTPSDITTSASAHSQSLVDRNADTPQTFARVSAKLYKVGGGMVVAEWSGALNPGSLTHSGNSEHGEGEHGERKMWIEAQMGLYERCCAGWFFWTYKKEGRGGGKEGGNGGRKDVDVGWCLRDAVDGGVFPDWVGLRLRATGFNTNNFDSDGARRDGAREACKEKTLGAHISYWSRYPGTYHHQRFGDGFGMGWDDAWRFFLSGSCGNFGAGSDPGSGTGAYSCRTGSGIGGEGFGGKGRAIPELGIRGAWLRRRTSRQDRKEGTGFWEFEHGFNQGVDAARVDFERVWCG